MAEYPYSPLPPLRFDDGDVIVQLTTERDEWLLVHRSVLQAAMPQLGVQLKESWGHPQSKKHPKSGQDMEVYTIALKPADDTVVLAEGFIAELSKDERNGGGTEFHRSELSTGGWGTETAPDWIYLDHLFTKSARIHQTIIAIIYGYPVELRDFCAESWDDYKIATLWRNHDEISALLAYAEYYGCLERVAPKIADLLLARDDIWETIQRVPSVWIWLAKKLRCQEMYLDALRYILASPARDWENIGDVTEMSPGDAALTFMDCITRRDATISQLEADLLGLQLAERKFHTGVSFCTGLTTFSELILERQDNGSHNDRLVLPKSSECLEFFAKSVYGQWLAQQIAAEGLQKAGKKIVDREAGAFDLACKRIIEAAESDEPLKLFSITASSGIASIFDSRPGGIAREKSFEDFLMELLKRAAELVRTAFAEKDVDLPDGTVLTARCSQSEKHSRCDGYKTYLALDETELPWNNWDPSTDLPWHKWSSPGEQTTVHFTAAHDDTLAAFRLESYMGLAEMEEWSDMA